MAAPAAQPDAERESHPPLRSRVRLRGRPSALTDAQAAALIRLHLFEGISVEKLASTYNVSPEGLRAALDRPYFRALIQKQHDELGLRLAAALRVLQAGTVKAAQNIVAKVDHGGDESLAWSKWLLEWHSKLLPQRVDVNVSGAVEHTHVAEVRQQVEAATARLGKLLTTAEGAPSMDKFLLRGTEGIEAAGTAGPGAEGPRYLMARSTAEAKAQATDATLVKSK